MNAKKLQSYSINFWLRLQGYQKKSAHKLFKQTWISVNALGRIRQLIESSIKKLLFHASIAYIIESDIPIHSGGRSNVT